MYKRDIDLRSFEGAYERPFNPNIPVPERVEKTDEEIVASVVKEMKDTLYPAHGEYDS